MSNYTKEQIEERKKKALQDVENSYNDPKSKFYRDNERFRWAVETINKRYEEQFNPLR